MDQKKRCTSLTPAVEQAAVILKYLAVSPKAKTSLAEISRGVGINMSKTYVILDALRRSGLLKKEEDSKLYSLGLGLISIGQAALERADYREAVKPFLQEIARETACTAMFELISNGNVVVTGIETSGLSLAGSLKCGDIRPLYYRSHGRIIAAYLPEEEQELLIKGKKHAFYRKDFRCSNDETKRDLEMCRKNGFASHIIDAETSGLVIRGIAAAAFDGRNYPIGSFVILGFFPESSVRIYGPKVAEVARRFSTLLGATMLVGP